MQAPIIPNFDRSSNYTKEEYDYIESFICNTTRVFYMESVLNDSWAIPEPFTMYTIFDFKCIVMRWFDDKIRVSYQLNIGDNLASGKVYDSRNIP